MPSRRATDRPWAGFSPLTALVAFALAAAGLFVFAARAQAADPCSTGNVIACENSQPGSPASEWDVTGTGDDDIVGFATATSVNVGGSISFKIKSINPYTIDIYRMGYYQGKGARKIASIPASTSLTQPSCITDAATGLIDCGNWAVSASWSVPATAVSGVYFAHIVRNDPTGGDNHIPFVVRNDASHSDMIFQASDQTWQAYNTWGGNSLYRGDPAGRAYKVSFNRPYNSRGTPNGEDYLFASEYPMIEYLEANGYDVSYQSGLDTDRAGALLQNHKIFLSVGHDEYWSGQQRANVEAARDAGVNLAFLSGNEVFWKTRWESSIDGSATANRTLVSYKETHANAKIDPTSVWTGTWRDPRFSPPGDGGRPENALTGQLWTVNCCSEAIKVPAADGALRFWRNTPVGAQAAGATATLPNNTLGYEWDEDVDNGFRPAGTINLSTSTYTEPQKLLDHGTTVGTASATHHLTLYRAPSGALVFGAGTVQWSWGLNAQHDGPATPVDPSMRQATVNLFADMGVQPTTLQSGLVAAVASTDVAPPSSTIVSPAAGAALANGTTVTVSGTATDAGGGKVGGVEVSTDAGATWHPAQGRASWTYSWPVTGLGAVTLLVRATDDSGNIQVTPSSRQLTVACPCSMFNGVTPATVTADDTASIEVGQRFKAQRDGWLTGVRFYKSATNTGVHTGTLWSNDGTQLATGVFSGETASGWQTLQFPTAVRVVAGTVYVASYHAPNGGYSTGKGAFEQGPETQSLQESDIVAPPLIAPRTTAAAPNGVFKYGASTVYPTNTFQGSVYFVSPVFDTVQPPDTTPPTVQSVKPVTGATSVPVTTAPKVTFSEPIKAGTLTLALTVAGGAVVAGTTTLDADRLVATFTPSAPLASSTTYTLSISGGTDDSGNALAAGSLTTFRTATAATPGACPCSVWPDDYVPAVVTDSDTKEVELGLKFRADQDGFVDGVRFYKGPDNTGTHVGTLWSYTGTQLASATFVNESTSGWQEVRFSNRVAITAGTTYVVSYHALKGAYSETSGALNQAVVNSPLTALANGDDGVNAVYGYGARAFPTSSGGGASYAVDVVFELPPDITPPGVASAGPATGATNVRTSTIPRVTFTEPVVSAGTVTLTGPAGAVAATVALDAAGKQATVTPSASLAAGTRYTLAVTGARDRAGNVMSAGFSSTFTTSGATACPCTLYPSDQLPAVPADSDAGAIEVGVRFTAAANGYVTAVRFYKGAGNTGTHTGNLWSADGALLSSATFGSESATGWQQVTLPAPIPVSAGTVYIASYSAPNGHYALDAGQLATAWTNGPLTAPADAAGAANGVYAVSPGQFPSRTYQSSAYGVDVSYSPVAGNDTVPPGLLSTSPVNGATSVAPGQSFVATFNEVVAQASISASVTAADGTVVPTTATAGADRTVTVQPTAALAYDTSYTVRISGSDLSGNAIASPVTWSVRTATAPTTTSPYSIWPDESHPVVASDSDTRPVELGVKFVAAQAGYVTAVRFYKGPQNTGVHTGSLWSATGTRLSTAIFSAESAAGWQQVNLAQPVALTAGSTYVASYHTTTGGYSVTPHGLATAVTRGPLTAVASAAGAPNGVYLYGAGGFPVDGTDTDFGVDVVFDTSAAPPADTSPPAVTGTAPADAATGVTASVKPAATFSEAIDPATLVATLTPAGGSAVAATVGYDAAARTATLTPAAALASATRYTVSVKASDLAGNPMAAATTWQFTTADTTAPTVTGRTPVDGAVGVAASVRPAATFSKAIDPATLVASLTPAGGSAIAATIGYDATARTATLTPAAALASATRYTVSVKASDLAGNPMAAPVTWQFTTLDTTPPVVSAVAASGSGTTGAVVWTTDEPSTSVVQYGTSATSLTGTATAAGSVTAHSVPLTGLAVNTRYYYRVTSADPAGNSSTSPIPGAAAAQYAPTVTPVVQTTVAQFTAGTSSSTYVSPRSDGDVTLAPAAAEEFNAAALPATWSSTSLASGSAVTVAGGTATVSGRLLRTTAGYTTSREIDAVATLKPVNGQWLGVTDAAFTGTGGRWAAFRTTTTGTLVAEVRNGTVGTTTTNLSSTLIGTAHRYEIDWTATAADFRVDGTTVASIARGLSVTMYAAVQDATVDANPLVLDSHWVSPYAATGTFTSSVVDAGATVDWRNLTPAVALPAGTAITYQVRTGPNATAGGTGWSGWTTVAAGADMPGTQRYLQYRATLTTSSARNAAPTLSSLQLGYAVP